MSEFEVSAAAVSEWDIKSFLFQMACIGPLNRTGVVGKLGFLTSPHYSNTLVSEAMLLW